MKRVRYGQLANEDPCVGKASRHHLDGLFATGDNGVGRSVEGRDGDLIEEIDSDAGFNEVEDQLLREEIGGAVDQVLDERERHVVALRYGLENGQPLSLRETGKVLGLSGERVRLIEREALRKLRDSNLINAVALGS